MASNIQRGTRKIDAGDWIRLKRLGGARLYVSNYSTNKDVTNPAPAPCCVTTDNNRMDRAEFGTSKFRRPASDFINYKAFSAADYVLETKILQGNVLSATRVCSCLITSDANKHNPLCIACR